MKKIRGKIHYFGNWARRINGRLVRVEGDGWEKALALYKALGYRQVEKATLYRKPGL